MTARKYRRLLAVLSLPLLVVGAIFFSTAVPAPFYASIICNQPLPTYENCRTTDGLGEPFDESIRRESPAWFDVYLADNNQSKLPTTFVSASPRLIERAQILEVIPYAGASTGPGSGIEALTAATGQSISIALGVKPNGARDAYLYLIGCNELRFDKRSSTYTAGLCGVPDGLTSIRFTTDDQSLNALATAASEEVASARVDLILHYLVGVPLFLVLFLLVSGLVWLVRRAWLYVAAG